MHKQDDILSEIRFIKQAIEGAKNHLEPIQKIFLIFGGMNLLFFLSNTLTFLLTDDLNKAVNISLFLKTLIYIVATVLFLRIFQKTKNSTNHFFRIFITFFAFVAVLLPVILLLVRLFYFSVGSVDITIYSLVDHMSKFLSVILFTLALTIVGSVTHKNVWTLLSVANVMVYLLLFTAPNLSVFGQFFFESSTLYSWVANSIGYLLLAGVLHQKREQMLQ